MEPVKVVVRYADGKVVKGYSNDFFPNKPMFHLGAGPMEKGSEVAVRDLKAVFFVKDFLGDPARDEGKGFPEGQKISGRKIEVTFADGEVMVGTTLGYDPSRPGFFLTPSDPKSNNLRVFVVSAAVTKSRYL